MIRQIIGFYERKILPGFKVDKDALVIDIGSGDKPFWRADVFLDKLSMDSHDTSRITKSGIIKNIGNFVNADIYKMPFRNKAFDFSVCSHVLEHLENPAHAIKEIQRISKRGYIEVPDPIQETIKPRSSHYWFVYQKGDKLIFVRKSKQNQELMLLNGRKHINLLYATKDPFIHHYWTNKINFEIVDNLKKTEKQYTTNDKLEVSTHFAQGPYLMIMLIIRKLFYKPKSKNLLKDSLRQKPQ